MLAGVAEEKGEEMSDTIKYRKCWNCGTTCNLNRKTKQLLGICSDWTPKQPAPIATQDAQAMLDEAFPIIDNALNYFYPSREEDGDKAMDARAALFALRDKIKAYNS